MTYEKALASYKAVGAANANDIELTAGYCAHVLQTVVGAVSPKLVFDGAVASGISSRDLAALAVNDIRAVDLLQWI